MGSAGDLYAPMVDGTKLSPQDEAAYQAWKGKLPPRLQYEGDYDLRGFYKKNPRFSVDQPGQHMTDEFKLPNHRTFSNESKYFGPDTQKFAGSWADGPGGRSLYLPFDPAVKGRVEEDRNGENIPVPELKDPEKAKAALLASRLYGTVR